MTCSSLMGHAHAQVDGSFEYEYTQQPTNPALPLANPQDFGPTYTAEELNALVYNVLTQDNSQQGSALATLQSWSLTQPMSSSSSSTEMCPMLVERYSQILFLNRCLW